jgi:hypothetical protein
MKFITLECVDGVHCRIRPSCIVTVAPDSPFTTEILVVTGNTYIVKGKAVDIVKKVEKAAEDKP